MDGAMAASGYLILDTDPPNRYLIFPSLVIEDGPETWTRYFLPPAGPFLRWVFLLPL